MLDRLIAQWTHFRVWMALWVLAALCVPAHAQDPAALQALISLGKPASAYTVTIETLQWMVIIHLTFVVSGVLLALMDLLSAKTDKH